MATPKVPVNHVMLRHARESCGCTLEQAAKALRHKGVSKISSWEVGTARPTLKQAMDLAKEYGRSLGYFYLPTPPTDPKQPDDFRRSLGAPINHKLRNHIRELDTRRQVFLDLSEPSEIPAFQFTIERSAKPETAADQLRGYFGLTFDDQKAAHGERDAFGLWQSAIERKGCLVFQIDSRLCSDVSGLSIFHRILPVIAVKGGGSWGRRLFTLVHELAHLGLGQSAISEIDFDPQAEPQSDDEGFCDQVAAETLMPGSEILPLVAELGLSKLATDLSMVKEVAHRLNVSVEAAIVRLASLGHASWALLKAWRDQPKKPQKKKASGNPYKTRRARFGDLYLLKVYGAYYEGEIGLSRLCDYVGATAKTATRLGQELMESTL